MSHYQKEGFFLFRFPKESLAEIWGTKLSALKYGVLYILLASSYILLAQSSLNYHVLYILEYLVCVIIYVLCSEIGVSYRPLFIEDGHK